MSDMGYRNDERDASLGRLYDMLFQAWPLMRRRLLPPSALQAEFGMPLSHVQVLVMLDHRGSLSITEISQCFGIAKPNITPVRQSVRLDVHAQQGGPRQLQRRFGNHRPPAEQTAGNVNQNCGFCVNNDRI